MTTQNPLESVSSLPFKAVPFQLVRDEHYLPALKSALSKSREAVEKIKSNSAEPNFENTILALEAAYDDLHLVSSVFHNLFSAHTNDEMQKISREFDPEIAKFSTAVMTDAALFQKVKAVHDNRQKLGLKGESLRLTEKTFKDFARNGALLDPKKKEELAKIDEELAQLAPAFSENVLKATNAFSMLLTTEEELAGLSESVRAAAQHAAEEKGLKGWLFTLQAPSFMPFMKFSTRRDLRERMWRAYGRRAFGDEFDNQKNVLRTVELREKRAQLLGYANHAAFVLEERMAETPDRVQKFLHRLLDVSKTSALKEVDELKQFAIRKGGPSELKPWDIAHFSEQLQEEKYKFHEEELRPYFKLENVIQGAFEHAKILFGLDFKHNTELPVYHPDVKVYEVYNKMDGAFIGLFYTDFFPRESKRGGAWMTTYHNQGLFKGEMMRPHVSIVCNFTKPTPNKPSLLTLDEVRTLFHEFGHSLHGLLSQCTYSSISGTNVYWDFVELPSQIMENWVLEKEALDLFAFHYETGEKMPADLAKKVQDSSKFMAGWWNLRQLQFALLDMAWHTTPHQQIKNVDEFENAAIEAARVLPREPGGNVSTSFSHIFAGGYSAGYYSYKWAEVLDADAFEFFKEKGIFNTEVSRKFKDFILSKGDTEHPMELYKKFRGREPDPDALLRREGLI